MLPIVKICTEVVKCVTLFLTDAATELLITDLASSLDLLDSKQVVRTDPNRITAAFAISPMDRELERFMRQLC